MDASISNLLTVAGVALLLAAAWAGTVAYTYWNARRHGLSNLETIAWVALATVFPLFGFFAYLFARILVKFFSPRETGQKSDPARRITALKPEPFAQSGTATFYAPDLANETRVDRPDVRARNSAPQTRNKRLFLTATLGPCMGKRFPIQSLPVRLGRGKEADIRLDEDLSVSRGHAQLYDQDGALRIQDQNSTHGTLVNGRAVQDAPLSPGDRIRVGETELLVTYADE